MLWNSKFITFSSFSRTETTSWHVLKSDLGLNLDKIMPTQELKPSNHDKGRQLAGLGLKQLVIAKILVDLHGFRWNSFLVVYKEHR